MEKPNTFSGLKLPPTTYVLLFATVANDILIKIQTKVIIMKAAKRLKLMGLGAYLLAIFALQQVIIIPLIALLSIVAIYKSKSEIIKSHAKYIISVFVVVISVVLVTANVFNGEQQVFAAMVAISIAFLMLAYGALRMGFSKKPFANRLDANLDSN